jgi:HNH endonuclease
MHSTDLSLEARLHEEMIAIYQHVGRETGYWAHRYLQRVKRVGGLQAAKDWLKPKSSPTSGLQKLVEIDRLDLSLESLVLRKPLSSLFTNEELHVAQKRLNIISSFRLSEEVSENKKFVEGSVCQVTINSYELNIEARRCCIEHHGTSCRVCGFNFEEKFGSLAKGFIHVHHLKPLSEIKKEYEVDPIADLCPVCPNCHAIIHLGGKTRSIDEVKLLLSSAE